MSVHIVDAAFYCSMCQAWHTINEPCITSSRDQLEHSLSLGDRIARAQHYVEGKERERAARRLFWLFMALWALVLLYFAL